MASPAVQSILDVIDVRDDTIILRDGSIRAIIAASSVNFELKSVEEQEAIILRYQAFLNSLDFSLQILVQSRDLDISPYLGILRERQNQQTNELLRIQTSEYLRFIEEFVDFAHIMQKRFYIIIPFTPVERRGKGNKGGGIMSILQAAWKPEEAIIKLDEDAFHSYRDQLFQRVSHIETTINGAGVRTQRLNSEQLISLLYQSYNPGAIGRAAQSTPKI